MSDEQQSGQPEPTMEEILSSIRRIISDEDQPEAPPVAAKAPPAVAAKEAPPAAKPAPAAAAPDPFDDIVIEPDEEPEVEDVLELTKMVNEDGTVTDIDDLAEAAEPEPVFAEEIDDVEEDPPFQAAVAAAAPVAPSVPIMGDMEANLAAAALNQLVVEMPKYIGIGQGLTVEEITRELLRPMLKQWLDAHLPGTVERLVQEEIARVSRLHR
jgi:cell pole-organizing protein PopZ